MRWLPQASPIERRIKNKQKHKKKKQKKAIVRKMKLEIDPIPKHPHDREVSQARTLKLLQTPIEAALHRRASAVSDIVKCVCLGRTPEMLQHFQL